MTIQQLRERRAAKAQEARTLLDTHTGDKWNATVSGQVDALYNEISEIEAQITAHTRMLAIEDDKGNSNEQPGRIKDAYDPKDPKNATRVIFNKWMRGGPGSLTADDHQVLKNTLSTTTGSQGGFAVPSLISQQLYDAMKAFGTMRALAEIIPTTDGKPLSFPGSDGTAEVGEWIAQNVTATALDPVFTSVSLNVFKASSKIVAVPLELLQDATIDMEGFVRKRLAQRLGRIGNQAFTVGAGTTLPDGIIPKATVGKVGIVGQTLTIIYDDLVDLIHSVDPAYRSSSAVFMFGDALLRVIRKIKDSGGRPIWTPSYDGGINIGLNKDGNGGFATAGALDYTTQTVAIPFDYLMGYKVYVNNDIAAPGANAITGAFGEMSYYKIRDAMDVEMFRFTDSNYTRLGQVGFLAWCRMGGNLVDPKAVATYQHSAT